MQHMTWYLLTTSNVGSSLDWAPTKNNHPLALGVRTLDMIECEEALESGVLVAGAKNYDFTPFRAVAEGVTDDVIDRFINALNFNRRFS